MSELLESRWQDTKTALLEGLQGNKKGVMEADSARQVRSQLRDQKMMPLDVAEVVKKNRKQGAAKSQAGRGISVTDMALTMRQLSTLVGSGMPLEECIGAAAEQSEKPRVNAMLMSIRSRVMEGHSFAKGIGDFPQAFPDLYRATIEAGEQSGHLDVVLERLADYSERRHALRQKTLLALLYPCIIVVIAIDIFDVLVESPCLYMKSSLCCIALP